MDSKADPITHIYTEGLVETLCGDKNEKKLLSGGYFFSKREALFWNNSRNTVQVNNGPITAGVTTRLPAMGKLPELGEGNNYIAVPKANYKTTIHRMCNDCLAIMRLRELE